METIASLLLLGAYFTAMVIAANKVLRKPDDEDNQ